MTRALLQSLPPPPSGDDFARVREIIAARGRKFVVLDDDPTGTQTVHGIPVLTEWSVESLATALLEPGPAFYILTNTRALDAAAAIALNREVAQNLQLASQQTQRSFDLASRSDSTLRGHFPHEVDALLDAFGDSIDNVIVVPAFFEGGRYTVNNVHYVADGERLVPAGETEFARDATFGYRSSNLAEWVEEKTGGRVRRADVAHIGIELLRGAAGAVAVKRALLALRRGAVVTVDAVSYADLEVFVHGLLQAEMAGRRCLARCAAGFVRVRAGIGPRPLLDAAELSAPVSNGGLIVVGSYVAKTTAQLAAALLVEGMLAEEIHVARLGESGARSAEIHRVTTAAEAALREGRHALLYTSRTLESGVGRAGELTAAQIVSSALVEIVSRITVQPRFFIAKGGITSSELATKGLGVRKALILGQAAPGVPVWRLGPESRFPGMAYIVFPGNVGDAGTLHQVIERASQRPK
jgi:uncharacterized protein YgbK (DUF1537 family)